MTIHGILHTIAHSSWKKAANPVQENIVATMSAHRFPFMGAAHSMADYYEGYGFISSVFFLMMACIYWVLSGDSESGNKLVPKVTMTVSIGLILCAILEWMYFFPFASAITFAAAVCGILSVYVNSGKTVIA